MSPDSPPPGGIELFRGLSGAQASSLLPLGRPVHLAAGATIFRLGDAAREVYVIQSGQLSLTMPIRIRDAEEDAFVEEKGPGDLLGWSALAPPHRYTLTARATEDTDLTAFIGTELQAKFTLDPATGVVVLMNLIAMLGHRMHQTQAMWLRELQRTLDTRVG